MSEQLPSTELRAQLRSGYVSRAGLKVLVDAEGYNSASSMGALKDWLSLLYSVVRAGRRVEVEGELFIHSKAELDQWTGRRFPGAFECFFSESENER